MKKLILILFMAGMIFGAGMTLEDCIKTAEKNNTDIKISELDKTLSRYSLKDARNRFFDITGSGSYTLNGDDDDNLSSTTGASIGLSGTVSPYLFHNYIYSEISAGSTDINHTDIVNTLRYRIINSFFQVLIANERLKVQTDIAEYSQKKYEEAELKFSMGNISKSDLLNFEVSRSSDIIDLKSAQSNLRREKQNLIYYMNADLIPDSLELSYDEAPVDEEVISEESFISEALKNRPDIIIQKNSMDQKALSLKMQYDNYLPSLSGTVSYGYSRYDDLNNDLFSYTNDGLSARLSLSLNLTYSDLNGIDRSKVEIRKSKLQMENKTASVKNEIRLKILELENQKNNLELAFKNVELAKENLDLADKLFFIGDKSATDYLQARNDYINARYRKINTQYNYILAKYELLNSAGRKP